MSSLTQEERIATLERQVTTLCSLLGLTPEAVAEGGVEDVKLECRSIAITARNYLSLEGNSTEVRSDQELTIRAGTSLEAKAGSSLDVQSNKDMRLKTYSNLKLDGGAIHLDGSGTTSIQGSLVQLNKGSLPVARVGDLVTVSDSAPGTISSGSTTVMA